MKSIREWNQPKADEKPAPTDDELKTLVQEVARRVIQCGVPMRTAISIQLAFRSFGPPSTPERRRKCGQYLRDALDGFKPK